MQDKTVVITEKDGAYTIQNNGIAEFALLGILECIVFEMKTARRESPIDKTLPEKSEPVAESNAAAVSVSAPPSTVPNAAAADIRTRIGNAVKAIRDLGGQVPDFDADQASIEELQEELSVLTEQYKRLKNSKTPKK